MAGASDNMDESTDLRLLLRLCALGVVVFSGVAIAASMQGKRPAGWPDAVREIAGAVVAGFVVAGVVVWFEQRREDERVIRENERDERMQRANWVAVADRELWAMLMGDHLDSLVENRLKDLHGQALHPDIAMAYNDYEHLIEQQLEQLISLLRRSGDGAELELALQLKTRLLSAVFTLDSIDEHSGQTKALWRQLKVQLNDRIEERNPMNTSITIN